jgi:hypothetical protein
MGHSPKFAYQCRDGSPWKTGNVLAAGDRLLLESIGKAKVSGERKRSVLAYNLKVKGGDINFL